MGTVLLDLDGTLTDPQLGITRCIRHALGQLNLPVPQTAELLSFIGPPLQDTFDRLFGDPALTTRCVALYRERFSEIGLYENELYAGIPAALHQLREAGHRLILATSKLQIFARRIIDHFELSSLVETVYGSEPDGTRAHKPALIAHILEMENVSPATAVMIGDREHDVLGAKANNIPTIGVLYGYGSRDELIAAGAAALASSPMEIPTTVATVLSIGSKISSY